MLPGRAVVRRRLRWGTLALATVLAAVTVIGDADARTRHRHHYRHRAHHTAAPSYDPAYASIVVDGNSGAVLQASNADSPRHPASLTKMMTLYMLFERLAAGKMKMSTEMPVSAHAASMAPTKLGLKPGETLSVGDAIKGIVTQSANDAAVVVAEALGGTESDFAKEMTAKARALGMMHTHYHNASGLPDDAQITTARDQAVVARALQDRFPQYFHFFSLRAFAYHGRLMRNHNHLLGRVDGVDGMKTGYIRASGFNIVTDVHRHGRHLVVVVFGGRTARVRDAHVVRLIERNITTAALKRTAPMVMEGWQRAVARAKPAAEEPKVASGAPLAPAASSAPSAPAPGSTDPIKPIPVKTFMVQQPSVVPVASLAPLPPAGRTLRPAPATANPATITNVATVVHNEPPPLPPKPPDENAAAPRALQIASASNVPVQMPRTAAQELLARPHGGWMIQVGAFDAEKDAKERLTLAQSRAKAELAEAAGFTEPVAKGSRMLYRARFAGLDKTQAETACKSLKRSEIPCMMLRN